MTTEKHGYYPMMVMNLGSQISSYLLESLGLTDNASLKERLYLIFSKL